MPDTELKLAGPGTSTRPLEILYEHPDIAGRPLPAGLHALYGGGLDLPSPCLYANFVASIDGVAALGPEHPSSGSAISGREPADRFVMGLLRAFASAVLIGAGTLRATPTHHWTPEHVYRAAAPEFAALRASRGLSAQPELVIATARGDLPADHPALEAGAVIATTEAGARRLAGRIPGTCTILALGDSPTIDPAVLMQAVRARGHAVVLTEAGPRLIGRLVDRGLLDELFLTIAPVLAGRDRIPRAGLIADLELLPGRRETADLVGLRRQASVLFLRYRLSSPQPQPKVKE
ncbi:dihydrofolate reductase family protein [Actinospica robiniae]|uniref:dihydrofolate reductase family protein n=1 Tax=Actinospica robiniae TaxID=304901 RepID=UPI000409B01D|nr:dihydrofolate reductase family protein [Actinospica robiniae]